MPADTGTPSLHRCSRPASLPRCLWAVVLLRRAVGVLAGRRGGIGCLALALGLGLPVAASPAQAAGKVDTRAFSAYFASQSARIYDHLLKVTDYYSSLAKEGNTERIKDALALRATLSACWDLFLNAGDMVFVYNQLDGACPGDVERVGGLLGTGLGVIAGKLDKELEWMALTEKNVGDQPISVELTQARKDISAAASYFRQAATLFAPPPGAAGETRQPVAK